MTSYTDKNFWIIGASTGIGRELALELARRGGKVAISARSADKLEQLKEQMPGDHHAFALDVANAEQFRQTALEVKKNCSA